MPADVGMGAEERGAEAEALISKPLRRGRDVEALEEHPTPAATVAPMAELGLDPVGEILG